MIVALWGRTELAGDSGVEDGGGWGGITLAYNTRSPQEVDAVLSEAHAAGATIARPRGRDLLGRLFRGVRGPRRAPLGGGSQPTLDAGRGRIGQPVPLTNGGKAQACQRATLAAVHGWMMSPRRALPRPSTSTLDLSVKIWRPATS